MKNIVLILSLSAAVFSCISTTTKVIDGCDYIVTTSSTGHGVVESLTHKGNCRNPIHFPTVKKDSTISLPLIQKQLK